MFGSFFSDKYDDWRFSFVSVDYNRELTNKGKIKIKQKITPIKRFSYLVGKNEPNHTAQLQLCPLLEKSKVEIDDIAQAFSVEKVTKEFFEKYKNLCLKISDELKLLRKMTKN